MGTEKRKAMANAKEHSHELIERLAPRQATAVVGLLEAMLDSILYRSGISTSQ